ncbi:MAG: SufD family Fe-S cluster assembly protein, partial [Clostridia bacterium]|nr:SufD family Fe-S cluster assembly protein [Clostridia bacterium]
MDNIDKELLKTISNFDENIQGAYNIRKNGAGVERKVTENVNIVTKTDVSGIDIIVKENTKKESVHIPVIITKSGLMDVVYNDFYIGKNAEVEIIAGCGIHNDNCDTSEHDGIHRFYLEENAKVVYIEKHYGEGEGTGKKILNPVTEVYLKSGATMEMNTIQISGVDDAKRITKGVLENDTSLIITEKIMTENTQCAETEFNVELNGDNSSTHVVSRSFATESSNQKFVSKVIGNAKCFAHVECDAIIKDNGKVVAIPQIIANNVNANLIHEATIGKIAG